MKNPLILLAFLLTTVATAQMPKPRTQNVFLITLDGMRWQEVFTGADSVLLREEKYFKDPAGLTQRFWRSSAQERRKVLFPFLWETIASKGQLYGNRAFGNKVNVSNSFWFSYPGYNEILTGIPDRRINSNDKKYNPNTTVLEFIHQQPGYQGQVVAFTSWEVFPYIINDQRSGILVSAGQTKASGPGLTPEEQLLNNLMPYVPNPLGEVRLDAFTFYYALEYARRRHPKVMFLSFDETDDFAHSGEYGAYLRSAQSADQFIATLWNFIQSDEQYKDKTTLLITTDHGRGSAGKGEWKDHGKKIDGADEIWFAVIGPDTPATGEVRTEGQLYQKQFARTLAAFLGLDYTHEKKAGEMIPSVFRTGNTPE